MKYLQTLELHNFLSHKNTVLEFDEISTVIVGDNGSGKTSVLRALDVLLFGSDFKESWQSAWGGVSRIKVTFTDGSALERTRNGKNQETVFFNTDGTKELFKGVRDVKDKISEFTGCRKVALDKAKDQAMQLQYIKVNEGRFMLDLSPEVTMRILSSLFSGLGIEYAKVEISKSSRKLVEAISVLESEADAYKKELEHVKKADEFIGRILHDYDMAEIEQALIKQKLDTCKYLISNRKPTIELTNDKIATISKMVSNLESLSEEIEYIRHIRNVGNLLRASRITLEELAREIETEEASLQRFRCAECGKCICD